jgi:hypothetical protein
MTLTCNCNAEVSNTLRRLVSMILKANDSAGGGRIHCNGLHGLKRKRSEFPSNALN